MPRLSFLLPVAAIVVLIAFLGYGLTRDPSVIPSALIGQPAPEFAVPRLQQPDQLITNDVFAGQVSVLNVWASWCVACRAEHPLVEELASRSDAQVLGLNYKDERADAMGWLARYGNPFAAIPFDYNGTVGIDWGVAAVPETFIIDRAGVVRFKQVGPIDRDTLEQQMLPLIQRLQNEPASTASAP